MITFTLPLPPSANNLFRNPSRGGRRPPTKAYEQWIRHAQKEIMAQRARMACASIKGRYKLTLVCYRTHGKSDLSNKLKSVEDVLVSMSVIEDDSLAEEIILKWGSLPGCVVTVEQIR